MYLLSHLAISEIRSVMRDKDGRETPAFFFIPPGLQILTLFIAEILPYKDGFPFMDTVMCMRNVQVADFFFLFCFFMCAGFETNYTPKRSSISHSLWVFWVDLSNASFLFHENKQTNPVTFEFGLGCW